MKNMKDVLFEKAAKKSVKLERFNRGTPEYEALFNGFIALFSVIEEADLEDEYYDWKRINGYMD